MSANVSERVFGIASDLFGMPPENITTKTGPETVEAWDSVRHLDFVLALEEAFDLQFSPEETEKIRNVGSAVALVEEKLRTVGQRL